MIITKEDVNMADVDNFREVVKELRMICCTCCNMRNTETQHTLTH